MNDTVVPQSVIDTLKRYAEQGYTEDFSPYQKGMEDGSAALAQAVLELLHIPYNAAKIKE